MTPIMTPLLWCIRCVLSAVLTEKGAYRVTARARWMSSAMLKPVGARLEPMVCRLRCPQTACSRRC